MSSSQLGTDTSPAEVTGISRHGIWLLVNDREYFLSYEQYPWFRDARVSEILNVELHHHFHLYWPALDVDLDIASLEAPSRFPLVFNKTPTDL